MFSRRIRARTPEHHSRKDEGLATRSHKLCVIGSFFDSSSGLTPLRSVVQSRHDEWPPVHCMTSPHPAVGGKMHLEVYSTPITTSNFIVRDVAFVRVSFGRYKSSGSSGQRRAIGHPLFSRPRSDSMKPKYSFSKMGTEDILYILFRPKQDESMFAVRS